MFVSKVSEDPEREQQQLRIRRLVSWLVLIFGAAGVLTLVASCVATVRNTAGWTAWLVPLVCFVLSAGLLLLDRRLSEHPPMSVEVPVNLEPVLKEMSIACVDIDRLAGQLFEAERASQVLTGSYARTDESIDAAGEALAAEREGDVQRSVSLREQIRVRAQAIMDLRDEMVAQAGEATPFSYDGQPISNPLSPVTEPAERGTAGVEPTVDPWQYQPDQPGTFAAQPPAPPVDPYAPAAQPQTTPSCPPQPGYPQGQLYPNQPISSPSVSAASSLPPSAGGPPAAPDPAGQGRSVPRVSTDGTEGDSSPNRL
ncbi:hypothetical protein GCM10009765_17830 [Fodinicola feengrottensis]|uniref:Uncharacterized protein n=1 Tax=Fodinicola feengrottensis TaxID=435914 RepID=A0ABP4S838_9ACTN